MLRSSLFLIGIAVCFASEPVSHTFKLVTNKNRTVLIVGNETTPIVDCKLFGDRDVLESIKHLIPMLHEEEVKDNEEFEVMLLVCDQLQLHKEKQTVNRTAAVENKWREALHGIRPGTKWCGKGNVASDFDDLGEYAELDRCCRKHDHCPTYIEAHTTKFGLHNGAPYTKSACECDEEFRHCLLGLKSHEGNQLCRIFFNYLPMMECVSYDYPDQCTSSFHGFCLQKQKDTTEPKVYSFASAPRC